MKKNVLFFVIVFVGFFSSTILSAQYKNLKKAIVKKNVPWVKRLVEEHNLDINHRYEDNMTPLHFAAAYGNSAIVSYLVRNGANLNSKDNEGDTPLHLACYNHQVVIAKYLIYHGANVLSKNNKGVNPLDWVLQRSAKEEEEEEEEEAESEAENEKLYFRQVAKKDNSTFTVADYTFIITILCANSLISTTLLEAECHKARIIYRCLACVGTAVFLYKKQLFKKIAETPYMKKFFEFLKSEKFIQLEKCFFIIDAIINCLQKNNLQKAKKIIEENFEQIPRFLFATEIDLVNKKDKEGDGFIHLYTKKGNLEELGLILAQGADCNVQNRTGDTLLHIAVENNDAQAVELLVKTYKAHTHITNDKNKTPLDLLLKKIDTISRQNAGTYFAMVTNLMGNRQCKSDNQLIQLIEPAIRYNHPECAIAIIQKIDPKKEHLLHYFAAKGTKDVVHFLINKGQYSTHKNPFAKLRVSERKKAPLHIAAEAGNLEVVKYLIERCGAHKYAEKNPYIIAAKHGHLPIIVYFDDKQLFLRPHEKKEYTDTLRHILVKLDKKPSAKQYIETISRLARRFADITFDQLVYLLRIAEKNGALKQTKLLLDLWKQRNKRHDLFYHFIAQNNQRIVQFMIEACNYAPNNPSSFVKTSSFAKATKDRSTDRSEGRQAGQSGNALHVAAKHGALNVVAYLVQNRLVDINEPDKTLKTPFMWACIGGHTPTVKYLHQQGASINTKDKRGYTPLHWACYKGNLTTINYLIKECRVEVDPKDNNLFTPLHVACYHKNLPVITLLVNHGANIYEKTNKNKSPKKMYPKIKKLPCVQAYKAFYEEAFLGWDEDVLRSIKQDALDVNHTYEKRKTLLHVAIENGKEKIATLLIKKGNANVNQKDKDGNNPVHTLLKDTHMSNELIKLFAHKGADFYAQNNNGETPLDVADPKKRIFTTSKVLFDSFTKDSGRISPRFYSSIDKTTKTGTCNQCSKVFNNWKKELFLRPCDHNICFDCIEHIFNNGGYRCPFCNIAVKKMDEGKELLFFLNPQT